MSPAYDYLGFYYRAAEDHSTPFLAIGLGIAVVFIVIAISVAVVTTKKGLYLINFDSKKKWVQYFRVLIIISMKFSVVLYCWNSFVGHIVPDTNS